jgi:hypothetical protein
MTPCSFVVDVNLSGGISESTEVVEFFSEMLETSYEIT